MQVRFRYKKTFYFFILSFFTGVSFLLIPFDQNLFLQKNSSKIYDRNDILLYEILIPQKGSQSFVALEQMPQALIDSLVSIEDQKFYEHWGVDLSAFFRAVWQNIYYGEIVSGASTLEQQLLRNLFNHQERSFSNKIKEIFFALKLNQKYSKAEILEQYLNTVYFGSLAYGVEAAAQTYFGKSISKLDLAESAYLAGLPQAPSRYSPYVDQKAGKKRQLQILQILLNQKKISENEYLLASLETLNFQNKYTLQIKAPHFVMWVLAELEKKDFWKIISQGNYKIKTTLDLGLQENLQVVLNQHLQKNTAKNITNASIVILDHQKGEILSMLGSQDYFQEKIDGEVNVATSLRQPGSTLKPFLYALAFQKGLFPQTKILDELTQFKTIDGNPYEPKNYDLQYHGEVSLMESLAQSLNIPAVKILNYVGIPDFLRFLTKFGITTLNYSSEHYGLSLALGSGEVKLLELTQAYGVLANAGTRAILKGIQSIEPILLNQDLPIDPNFNFTWEENVVSPKIASQITAILSDNIARLAAFGEDNALFFHYPVAAKTGTSRNFRDNWTLGYSPHRTVGVWVGNSDGSTMINSSGITGAAPLFHSVMDLVMQNLPKQKFNLYPLENPTQALPTFEEVLSYQSETQGKSKSLQSILYPFNGDLFEISSDIPREKQVLNFKARQAGEWRLNQKSLGMGEEIAWKLELGEYTLEWVNANQSEKINFSVQ